MTISSDKFGSQLDRKVKFAFLLSLMCMFPEPNGTKSCSHKILQTRMDQRGHPMKMHFENFQIQKLTSQAVRARKVDEKNGVICPVCFFPS